MNNARDAYVSNSVSTASPGRLLVMLYDRLLLDLQRAIDCQERAVHLEASRHLLHAQEIVSELQSSLRIDAWDGAERLSSIYTWVHSELVRANVQRDVAATMACNELMKPLAEAWRQAALSGVAAG